MLIQFNITPAFNFYIQEWETKVVYFSFWGTAQTWGFAPKRYIILAFVSDSGWWVHLAFTMSRLQCKLQSLILNCTELEYDICCCKNMILL